MDTRLQKEPGDPADIVEIIHQPWFLIKCQCSHDFGHCKSDDFVKMPYFSQKFTGTNLLSSKTNIQNLLNKNTKIKEIYE